MRVSDVRKKYPEFFVTVEAAVWDDCNEGSYKGHPNMIRPMVAKRIAYNAATIATLELHKIASRKKIAVAGKTSANKQSIKRPLNKGYYNY